MQGLCSGILDDRVQNTVEQSFCDATDLGVDLHERYRRSEHVWPNFCWRIRILSYISIIQTSYLPVGWGVSYQSIPWSKMPSRSILVTVADLGFTYESNNLPSNACATLARVYDVFVITSAMIATRNARCGHPLWTHQMRFRVGRSDLESEFPRGTQSWKA